MQSTPQIKPWLCGSCGEQYPETCKCLLEFSRNMAKEVLYYTPPLDDAFNDMKKACLSIWDGYDDTYGYASQKKDLINNLYNFYDNFMSMAAMFDSHDIAKLKSKLSPTTLAEFNNRMTIDISL